MTPKEAPCENQYCAHPDLVAQHLQVLRLAQVESIIGYKKSWIQNAVKNGVFPRAIQIGPGRTSWRRQDVEAWLDSRINANNANKAVDIQENTN